MKSKILQMPFKWVILGIVVAAFAGHSLQTAFGLRTEFGWEIKTLPESNSAKWITSTHSIKVQGIVTADEDIKGITATYTILPALPSKPELLKIMSNISVPKSLTVEKTFENLPDGTYDIQFEVSLTSNSSLTQTTKSKIETIKKDTVPPEIKIAIPEFSDPSTNSVTIGWEISDKTSGINPSVELSYRKVSSNENFVVILDTSDSPYAWSPPPEVSGSVALRVVAKDKAGNRSEDTKNSFIKPAGPSKIHLPLLRSDSDIYEPNDTFAAAKELSFPLASTEIMVSGVISSVKDIDFFLINLERGQYRVSIDFNYGDLDLYVYSGPRRELLIDKSDSTNTTKEEVPFKNDGKDTIYIAIAEYFESPNHDFPISYTLKIRKE